MKTRQPFTRSLVFLEVAFFMSSAVAVASDCVLGCKDVDAYLTDNNWPDWECIRLDPRHCTKDIWAVGAMDPFSSVCAPAYIAGQTWACNGCQEICSNETGLEREAYYLAHYAQCEPIFGAVAVAHCAAEGSSGP